MQTNYVHCSFWERDNCEAAFEIQIIKIGTILVFSFSEMPNVLNVSQVITSNQTSYVTKFVNTITVIIMFPLSTS